MEDVEYEGRSTQRVRVLALRNVLAPNDVERFSAAPPPGGFPLHTEEPGGEEEKEHQRDELMR